MKDIISLVLEKLARLSEEIEIRRGRVVVLNDLAVILWGILKPIEEIRILISHEDPGEITHHVAMVLGLSPYMEDIYKSIKITGLAVLNPVTLPIFIVETPRSVIDEEVLRDPISFNNGNAIIRIPSLEPLIVKMLSIGKYPYTSYAYTLLITYSGEINARRLRLLLEKAGIKPDLIAHNINKYLELSQIFPELSGNRRLARQLLQRLQMENNKPVNSGK